MTLYRPSGGERFFPKPSPRIDGSFVNTTLGAVDYLAGAQSCTSLSTISTTLDVLRAIPFWAPARPGATIGRIAFENTTAAAGTNARIGIYQNVADKTSFYPGALEVDSGDISTATVAIHTFAPSVQLIPGNLYWMAIVLSSTRTLRGIQITGQVNILGIPQDVTGTTPWARGITVAHSYAALPDPFTGGGAYLTGSVIIPGLRYQFSA
jgi:hypothetical protein